MAPGAPAGQLPALAQLAFDEREAGQVLLAYALTAADAGPFVQARIVSPSTFSSAACDGMPQ